MVSKIHTNLLHVEELKKDEETQNEIQGTAKSWITVSTDKLKVLKDSPERGLFCSSRTVNRAVLKRCQSPADFIRLFTTIICYDLDLRIRGFALVKDLEIKETTDTKKTRKFLYLNYLSSDPQNLFNKIRDEASFLKGVGPSLIHFLFKKCVLDKYAGIFVKPLHSARSFFTHLGFVNAPDTGPQRRSMIWIVPEEPLDERSF